MPPSQTFTSMGLEARIGRKCSAPILRLSGFRSRGARAQQQIRTLRLGIWSSYLHSNLGKDLHRYHRILKAKSEAPEHDVPWDAETLRSTKRSGFKGFTCSAWRAKDSWRKSPENRCEELDGQRKETQRSTGRGIEDVELSALDKLLSNRDGIYDFMRSKSGLFSHKWSRTVLPFGHDTKASTGLSSVAPMGETFAFVTEKLRNVSQSQGNDSLEPEYEIDPITNRKVYKNKTANPMKSSQQQPENLQGSFRVYKPPFQVSTSPAELSPKPATDSITKTKKKIPIAWDIILDNSAIHSYRNEMREEESSEESLKHSGQAQENLPGVSGLASNEALKSNVPCNKPQVHERSEKDGLEEHDKRTSYDAFRYREPDGKLETDNQFDVVKDGLYAFDQKFPYGAIRSDEVDGKASSSLQSQSAGSQLSPTHATKDVKLLQAHDVRASSENLSSPGKESKQERLAKRRELELAFQKAQAQEAVNSDELAMLRKRKEMRKTAQDLRVEISELQNHVAHARGKVNAKIAELEAEALPEVTSEIEVKDIPGVSRNKHTARMETALDRTIFASPRSKIIAETAATEPGNDLYSKEPQGLETSYTEEVSRNGATKVPPKKSISLEAERDPYSKIPTGLETNYAEECAKIAERETDKDPYSKEPTGLETNYAEECALLSRQEAEQDPYSKEPMGLETSYAVECAQEGDKNRRVVFSSYEPSISSNLNRGDDAKLTPEEKKERKQWLRRNDKELVQEVTNIYEDSYGTIDCKHRQPPQPANAIPNIECIKHAPTVPLGHHVVEQQVPTLYKILAYDATMQSISEASTTSVVNDSASALTPAEALLRLSNPVKFFPYFEPLKRQGYEIVSGSGDVLVFRKVRSADTTPVVTLDKSRKSVNPIDGMQSIPVTGNFASPTGFVNHDLYSNSDTPFKSNIDVRREEPVFSGKTSWQDGDSGNGKQKKGRAKRLLIGAAWVGACSYAIGVVVEFFRTGGLDGKGPQGF